MNKKLYIFISIIILIILLYIINFDVTKNMAQDVSKDLIDTSEITPEYKEDILNQLDNTVHDFKLDNMRHEVENKNDDILLEKYDKLMQSRDMMIIYFLEDNLDIDNKTSDINDVLSPLYDYLDYKYNGIDNAYSYLELLKSSNSDQILYHLLFD